MEACELKSMSAVSYISQLSPSLFWDIDRNQMDVEHHSAGLIQRVLDYGTLQDWRLTRDFYGMNRIVADCKPITSDNPTRHPGTPKKTLSTARVAGNSLGWGNSFGASVWSSSIC